MFGTAHMAGTKHSVSSVHHAVLDVKNAYINMIFALIVTKMMSGMILNVLKNVVKICFMIQVTDVIHAMKVVKHVMAPHLMNA